MDAKQTLIIALNALVEVKDALPKNTFVDLLMGKGNKEIEENGWDEAEAFGAGEGRDEEFWHNLLEKQEGANRHGDTADHSDKR